MAKSHNGFLLKKEVDWSLLLEGFSIPSVLQGEVLGHTGPLCRGERRQIMLCVEKEVFAVTLINLAIDESRYPDHVDILQVRYPKGGDLACKLRKLFHNSYKYLVDERDARQLQGGKIQVRVPEAFREYIIIHAGVTGDELTAQCVFRRDIIG